MITAKAPGKLYIAGEYAVVENGYPAILVALNQFVTCTITEAKDEVGQIISRQYHDNSLQWRRRGDQMVVDKRDNPFSYILSAINVTEEFARSLNQRLGIYNIRIDSQLDSQSGKKYGLGSSAAVTVATVKALCEYYHNSSFLEHGGSPEKATRSAMVSAIDKYLRDNNKYTKGEPKITFPDVQDCLILVSNSFSTQTSYENQTKKAITNKFVQEAMTEFLRSRMEIYFIENKEAAEKIAAQVLINKRSRETAERTRINQKKKLTEKIDIANRVQKFVDCRTKDVERREIYIVEGDSAAGAIRTSRDAEFQGVMPVRGKILNCLKEDYPRIFKSDIIMDLMRVLGCGVEVSGKAVKDLNQFDLANLRWSKVVICTDGDVDGFQIRTLILTMLYRLCPTLIREGYVYIAETPLFEITCKEKGGEKTWFAYSEREKADILKELSGKKVNIQRSKGLGENDPEMMWLTTMNPESRRLIKVMPTDVVQTAQVFDILLGDNLAGRKEHIAQHGAEYLDDLDVS